MIKLEEEISRIKRNIVGHSEVCRKGKGSIIMNNTHHTIYYSGSDVQRHWVSFMVNKTIARNVTSFRGLSDRVAELTVRINKRYQLKCVHVYLPTTSYDNEEVEKLYEEINITIIVVVLRCRRWWLVPVNAHVSPKTKLGCIEFAAFVPGYKTPWVDDSVLLGHTLFIQALETVPFKDSSTLADGSPPCCTI